MCLLVYRIHNTAVSQFCIGRHSFAAESGIKPGNKVLYGVEHQRNSCLRKKDRQSNSEEGEGEESCRMRRKDEVPREACMFVCDMKYIYP